MVAVSGTQVAELRHTAPGAPEGFAVLRQGIDATPYRGHRVRLTARVRVQQGRGQLWMRVGRQGGQLGFFDNSADRPVTGYRWTDATIVGVVADDAKEISLGLLYFGGGHAQLDDVVLADLGGARDGDTPAAPLSATGQTSLAALARLAGLVRFFHPSDAVMGADWTRHLADATLSVEPADSPEALAEALTAVLTPLAPAVQIWAGTPADAPAPRPPSAAYLRTVTHNGLGADWGGIGGAYTSETSLIAADDADEVVVSLPGGVSARVPLAAAPQEMAPSPLHARPEGWFPVSSDRSSRLAAVMGTWSVLQHFYPYWDVIEADWPAALRDALAEAAEAEDLGATLRRLIAHTQDGHGRVTPPPALWWLPLSLTWLDEGVVVTWADGADGGLRPGDRLLAIDGTGTDDLIAEYTAQTAAASAGRMRERVTSRLWTRSSDTPTAVRVQHIDGTEETVTITPISFGTLQERCPSQRPEDGAELASGIHYFDLNRAPMEALEPLLETFASARGVIFDLRGYPGSAGRGVLPHLTDTPLQSAIWKSPIYTRPDQEGVDWNLSGRWHIEPAAPRLPTNIVFITDSRAISYAESVMGIVEHYRLGEIVGEPTAGTNGDINRFQPIPGVTVTWTGMRVVKHDETEHHGVGILPTVPISLTRVGIAAGRDEVLEHAVEVARQRAR